MTLSLLKIILVIFENNFGFVWKLIESENHLKTILGPFKNNFTPI